MQAPVAKLVRTLNEVPGKFVRTLAALTRSTRKISEPNLIRRHQEKHMERAQILEEYRR